MLPPALMINNLRNYKFASVSKLQRMPLRWRLFRLICVLQILLTLSESGISTIWMFISTNPVYNFFNAAAFIVMLLLANLGLNIINKNYPNEPIVDVQKSRFNWLFLINFMLLSFSSGHLIAEYRTISKLYFFTNSIRNLPYSVILAFLMYLLIFIFHIIILYGLFFLRRLIYYNYLQKEFEFEKTAAK